MTASRVVIPTGEQKKKLRHPGLSRLLGQDYYGPSEAILAEVGIKGKSTVKPVIVDPRRLSTVSLSRVKVFVVIFGKIVMPALEQSNDPISPMRRCSSRPNRTACSQLGLLLAPYYG